MMALARYSTLLQRSFLGLLGLLFGSILLIYAISPRRDPALSTRAQTPGSTVPWAASIPESTWMWGMGVFALLLATNTVLLIFTTRSGGALR